MAERFITNFKKSLPDSLRKKFKLDTDESSEDENEESSEKESVENDTEEDSEEAKKKKQIGMLFRVVIILGLGYYALDEFVLSPQNQNETLPIVQTSPRKKINKYSEKHKESSEIKNMDQKPLSELQVSKADIGASTAPEVQEVTSAPIENIQVTPKEEEKALDVSNSESLNRPLNADSNPPAEEIKVESAINSNVPTQEEEISSKIDQVSSNVPDAPVKVNHKEPSSMIEKIVETATETLPPSYDNPGRGLVYNCKDKHWACLDKESFIICNKNMKWNKFKGSPAECVIRDVYASDDDCSKVQKYNVSTNQLTDFCQ